MKRTAVGLSVVACGLGIVLVGLHTLNLLFSESLHPTPGTYAFFVTITDDAIADFPIVEPVGVPTYFYGSGDGPKPASQEVTYPSRAARAVLLRRASEFGAEHGFAPAGEEASCPSGFVRRRAEERLEVCIDPENDTALRVTARLIGFPGVED